ncbi:hypothetical protein [Streptomyces sp. NPDC002587]
MSIHLFADRGGFPDSVPVADAATPRQVLPARVRPQDWSAFHTWALEIADRPDPKGMA